MVGYAGDKQLNSYGDGYTDGLVSQYVSTVNGAVTTYTYTYNDKGYITKIVTTNNKAEAVSMRKHSGLPFYATRGGGMTL